MDTSSRSFASSRRPCPACRMSAWFLGGDSPARRSPCILSRLLCLACLPFCSTPFSFPAGRGAPACSTCLHHLRSRLLSFRRPPVLAGCFWFGYSHWKRGRRFVFQ